MTDDTRLEQAFRDGLRQAAARAEVGLPLGTSAKAGAKARRRRRWAVAGTVAAVVAVSGTAFAVRSSSDPEPQRQTDRTTTAPTPTSVPSAEWRAESWHGLTVDVPSDWGWGTAPIEMSFDAGRQLLCGGPGEVVRSNGERLVNPTPGTSWVGRPIMLSDACGQVDGIPPEAPYVWLGADLEPGTVELADGYVQETVEAFGTTLTVASPDRALREHVLASARATTGCAAHLEQPPEVLAMPIEGLRPVHSAQICAYQGDGRGYDLVYASSLDAPSAQRLYSHGVGRGRASCDRSAGEYVAITFSGTDGMGTAELTQDWVVDPTCHAMSFGGGVWSPLTDAGMALWSHNGLQAVLTAFVGGLG